MNPEEQRKSVRKKVCEPISFVLSEDTTLLGDVLDISAGGIKLRIAFKTLEEKEMINQIISRGDMVLELGEDEDHPWISTPVRATWNVYKIDDTEKIFELGLNLQLTQEQQREWEEFYNKL